MSLDELLAGLEAQVASSASLRLDSTVWPEMPLEPVVEALGLPPDVSMTVVEVNSRTGVVEGRSTFIGKLPIAVGLRDVPVRLGLWEAGSDIAMVVELAMGTRWTFTDSFPDLDIFPFSLLRAENTHFVYSNIPLPSYAWPGEQGVLVDLAPGMSMLTELELRGVAGLGDLLDDLLPETSLRFHGPFGLQRGQQRPVGRIATPLGLPDSSNGTTRPLTFGPSPLAMTLHDPELAIRITAAAGDRLQQADLLVAATFQDVLEVEVVTNVGGDTFQLVASAPEGTHEGVADLIRALPRGKDSLAAVPHELSDIFEEVSLRGFSMTVDTTPSVDLITLAVGTTNPWPVIPGVLTLEDLHIALLVVDPAGLGITDITIGATASFLDHLFGGPFHFTVTLEHQDSWEVETVSGVNFGAVQLQRIVSALAPDAPDVPPALSGLTFSDFGLELVRDPSPPTYTYAFHAQAELFFPLLGTEVLSRLTLSHSPDGATRLLGVLGVGEHDFTITLNLTADDAVLHAAWWESGEALGIEGIVEGLGLPAPSIPTGLDLALTGATFDFDHTTKALTLTAQSANYGQALLATAEVAGTHEYMIAFQISRNLSLSDLPLVGKQLPRNLTVSVNHLGLVYASATLDPTDEAAPGARALLKALADQADRQSADGALERGFHFTADLQLGAEVRGLDATAAGTPPAGDDTDPSDTDPTGIDPTDTDATATPAAADADPVTWVVIQKAIGPFHFQRIGVRYASPRLTFLLDASLQAGPLSIELQGLSTGVDPKQLTAVDAATPFAPTFDLAGLALDFRSETVEVGGTFARRPATAEHPYDEYAGAATIRSADWLLSAVGSYAYVAGHPSLFVYATLDAPLGGPPFMVVTGLAAGFGYNRDLVLPTVDHVETFPLVSRVIGSGTPADTDEDPAAQVAAVVADLGDAVPPSVGQYWLAVGIRFTSFKLVDSFALLTVGFGRHFEVELLGVATAVVPTPDPDADPGSAVPPVATIQMAVKASYDPAQGALVVQGRLTPASFVFSSDCVLSGGFAFAAWFNDSIGRAGDFVVSIGGYRAGYVPPSYYPVPPRVRFTWTVTPQVLVTGDAYFALTPGLMMAGGHLRATYTDSALSAWFSVGADFMLGWKPYHYRASLSLDMGVSYTYSFLGTHHLTVDVGADLDVWGPEFSGHATVHLTVVSFTVHFGRGDRSPPDPLGWTAFRASFLPADDAVCALGLTGGLVRTVSGAHGSPERWVVNARDLRMTVSSVIPLTQLSLGGADALPWPGAPEVGIAPMALAGAGLTSTLEVSIRRQDGSDAQDEFAVEAVTGTAPAALWGTEHTPAAGAEELLDGRVTGAVVQPGKPPTSGATATVERDVLGYAQEWVRGVQTAAVATRFVAADIDVTGREVITATWTDPHVVERRRRLLEAAGISVSPVPDAAAVAAALHADPTAGTLVGAS
ncbi:MAG: DUF6603 domain-containing protein [Ornithinimicrobium sp.]